MNTKVTIEKVYRGEQETQFGLRNKIGIKVQEEEVLLSDGRTANVVDKWLSMLAKPDVNTGTEEWEAGKQVEVEITEKNGFFNFKVAGNSVEDRLKKLEDAVFGAKVVKDEPIDFEDSEF